jgi:hypothetical protein
MKKKELTKFRENYTDWSSLTTNHTEGLALAVHFDEKEDIKQYGVKWDADNKQWWLPKAKATDETVRELNAHKMIVGPYGDVDQDAAAAEIGDEQGTDFTVRNMDGNTVTFSHYEKTALVACKPVEDGMNKITTIMLPERARELWDTLITGGYVRA